jgi:hypothetical protein
VQWISNEAFRGNKHFKLHLLCVFPRLSQLVRTLHFGEMIFKKTEWLFRKTKWKTVFNTFSLQQFFRVQYLVFLYPFSQKFIILPLVFFRNFYFWCTKFLKFWISSYRFTLNRQKWYRLVLPVLTKTGIFVDIWIHDVYYVTI